MAGPYFGSFERERKEHCTPEKIIEIARRKGEFRVSLRYRDDWLRKRCLTLRTAGQLVGGRRHDRELIFYPSAQLQQDKP